MKREMIVAVGLLAFCAGVACAEELSRKMPDVTLKNIEGGETSLSQFKGKVLLIDFWGSWCLPCLEGIEELKALKEKYGNKEFEIVGIAVKDKPNKVLDCMKLMRINYTVLMGNDATRYMFGGIKRIPTIFVVDKGGQMRHRFDGQQSRETLEAVIGPLLNETTE